MKTLSAKIDSYQKDGQTKGKYVTLGVIMSNDDGEFALLDPSISLAGVMFKQNATAEKEGRQKNTRIMCSIYDESKRQQQPQQQAQQQRPAQENAGDSIPF